MSEEDTVEITAEKVAGGDNYGIKDGNDTWYNLSDYADNKQDLKDKQGQIEPGDRVRLEVSNDTFYEGIEFVDESSGSDGSGSGSGSSGSSGGRVSDRERQENIVAQKALDKAVDTELSLSAREDEYEFSGEGVRQRALEYVDIVREAAEKGESL